MCAGVAPRTRQHYVGQLAGATKKKPAGGFLSDSPAPLIRPDLLVVS